MKKIFKLSIYGIAWGCTISVLFMMIAGMIAGDEFFDMTAAGFIRQSSWSMVVGVVFNVLSIVYENENMARWTQILIHMGTGFLVYFIAAFRCGWIPVQNGARIIVLSIIGMIIFGVAIWFGYYLHNKKQAQIINEKIKHN